MPGAFMFWYGSAAWRPRARPAPPCAPRLPLPCFFAPALLRGLLLAVSSMAPPRLGAVRLSQLVLALRNIDEAVIGVRDVPDMELARDRRIRRQKRADGRVYLLALRPLLSLDLRPARPQQGQDIRLMALEAVAAAATLD